MQLQNTLKTHLTFNSTSNSLELFARLILDIKIENIWP